MSDWISVNDREPEFGDYYLVTGLDIELELTYFCPEWGWRDSYEITHWAEVPPLPVVD